MIVYKIRRKSDGLFSMGGTTPRFNKLGKIWKQKNHLTTHLQQVSQAWYIGCEIVTYEVTETENSAINLKDYLAELNERKRLAEENYQKQLEESRRQTKLKAYLELKKEFDE